MENESVDGVCSIRSVTLFAPTESGSKTKQGSVNASVHGIQDFDSRFNVERLQDGTSVELGYALLSEALHPLVSEMAKNGNLSQERTLESMSKSSFPRRDRHATVFQNGRGEVAFNVTDSSESLWHSFAWRYNIDLYVVNRLASKLKYALEHATRGLRNIQDGQYFYDSPDAVWEAIGIQGLVYISLDTLLEKYMVNAMAGLMSYLLHTDDTAFHIQGGNKRLIQVAWSLAKQTHAKKCRSDSPSDAIHHMPVRVATVLGHVFGFELYDSNGQMIGEFDQVILADPMALVAKNHNIEFLIKSHMDETAVVQHMPLGGLIENVGEDGVPASIPVDHEGHSPLPNRLPPAVSRKSIQAVTTVVKEAKLQQSYWFSDKRMSGDWSPSQMFMTSAGKMNEYNVTGIFEIHGSKNDIGERWYKVCSSQCLSLDALQKFFGPNVQIVTENQWDIAPDYQGQGTSTNFLLYDGATGFHGHTRAGALYYPAAFEHAMSTPESQAMGALAVAKLIARRLDWIEAAHEFSAGDEL
ncbi:MAG: hypothetical protein SGILL_002509 [Bacillariaceae sp.]